MKRLDLIIDALESAHHTNDTGVMGLTKSRLDVALAAARELRELKPVGYMFSTCGSFWVEIDWLHMVAGWGCDEIGEQA